MHITKLKSNQTWNPKKLDSYIKEKTRLEKELKNLNSKKFNNKYREIFRLEQIKYNQKKISELNDKIKAQQFQDKCWRI